MRKSIKNVCRVLPILVAGTLVLPSLPGLPAAFAQETGIDVLDYMPDYDPPVLITSGDYEYYVNDNDTVTISEYTGNDEEIVIPPEIDGYPVSEIGYKSFIYKKMKSLSVPEGIKTISSRAFDHCEITDALLLPENIRIGNEAFCYAQLPEVITIPRGASVQDSAFSYCDTQKVVFLEPGAVLTARAFSYCDGLTQVICAEGVRLGNRAFEYCRALKNVMLCGDVEMDEEAFSYCGEFEITKAPADEYAVRKEMVPNGTDSTEDPADTLPSFPEISWEEYAGARTEEQMGGRFVQFPEQGIEVFIPEEYQPIELGSEYDGLYYIGYFTADKNSTIPGISVQYVDLFDFQEFDEYVAFVSDLNGLTVMDGDVTTNGIHCLLYEIPSNKTLVVGMLLEGGVLEIAFTAEEEDALYEMSECVIASIREIREEPKSESADE